MTTLDQKFIPFAQEVGQDYKELKGLITQLQGALAGKQDAHQVLQQIQTELNKSIETAKTQVKNDLMGGQLDQQLDTLKEIGDKLKELDNNQTISGAITQKLTEISQKVATLEQTLSSLSGLNMLAVYRQAKAG